MQALQKQSNQSITTSDGVKLAYLHVGSRASAPVVVLIHGWSGSKAYWELNVGGLARHCKVYAYDQRFHGESGKPRHVRALLWRAEVFYLSSEKKCAEELQAEHTACSKRLQTGVAAAYCCSFVFSLPVGVLKPSFAVQGHHVHRLAKDLKDFLEALNLEVIMPALMHPDKASSLMLPPTARRTSQWWEPAWEHQ